MKLSFTTLGCLEWDMDTIISKAKECGFEGVDFRGYMNELEIFNLPEFSTEIKNTVEKFKDANIEIPCFSSSIVLSSEGPKRDKSIDELKQYIHLCNCFDTPFIRVFIGRLNGRSVEEAIKISVDNLNVMSQIAEKANITLMLETHDDWSDSSNMKKLMENTLPNQAGVLWDVHHPYRFAGETPQKTWGDIGKWVKYTHFKDSIKDDSKKGYSQCLTGKGDVPIKAIIDVLKKGGYNGYLAYEWERKWHPEIEAPEIAFPEYVKFMRSLL